MSWNSNSNPKSPNKIPNWLNLPEDIWSSIFSNLYTIHIIENVQKVCILFRKICKQPSLYKVVNMTLPDNFIDLPSYNINKLTRYIVDRSCGCLLDLYLERFCDDDDFMYIILRSKNLKHLRLGSFVMISNAALLDAVKALSELEEVELICSYSNETIEAIGLACPLLKSFSLNDIWSNSCVQSDNAEALAIAKSMPNLRKLKLVANMLDNEGLKAILNGCPHLQSLDLRACFRVKLSGELRKRCGNIKHLRLPNGSTSVYRHQACIHSLWTSGCEYGCDYD